MTCLKEAKEKKHQEKKEKKTTTTASARAREGGVNVLEISNSPSAYSRGILRGDLKSAADAIGATADEVNAWLRYQDEVGWRYKSGVFINVLNYRRSLRMWHKVEERLLEERLTRRGRVVGESYSADVRTRERVAALEKKALEDPAMWTLCRERCANCGAAGCECGVKVPPDRQFPRPCRPEECSRFAERGDAP
jgi:hypothetical protein